MSASVSTTTTLSRRSRKRGPQRGTHHIDRRADQILAAIAGSEREDDLLTTREVSQWLAMSESWLEAGRYKGYGPPWVRLGAKGIRYQRGGVRSWLDQRGMLMVTGR